MTTPEIVSNYITNIPWSNCPSFKDTPEVYKIVLETIFDKTPLFDRKVSYSDDIWDFREYYTNKNQTGLRINFNKIIAPELKDYGKMFVVHAILDKNSPATAGHRLRSAYFIIKKIKQNRQNCSLYTIRTQDILDIIASLNTKVETKRFYTTSVCLFWDFLITYMDLDLPVDIREIEQNNHKLRTISKKERERNKIPDIPLDFYNTLINRATEVMRDQSADYMSRTFACGLIIISQLGTRPGDLLNLRTKSLKSIELPNLKTMAYFIHYTSNKPSRGLGPLYEFDMYCTELCREAYETLEHLRQSHPAAKKNDYLYLPYNRRKSITSPLVPLKRYPAPNHKLEDEFERFIYKYLNNYCRQDFERINKRKLAFLRTNNKEKGILFSIPDLRQFRVRVCTGLYNKGVPLTYIKKFMGHLTEEMLGYYVRPADRYKENMLYSASIIQSIVGDDIAPIGLNGEHLRTKIKEFVQNNHYNVYDDIESIINDLGNKLVIRAKTGGVCIKTSMIPCSEDKSTNKLLCAYNLCPNVYHFYWMADVTYSDFLTAIESYRSDVKNGYNVEASKQKRLIKSLINIRLGPEISGIEEAISKKGVKTLIEQYPSLLHVVSNLDEIKKEIEKWK